MSEPINCILVLVSFAFVSGIAAMILRHRSRSVHDTSARWQAEYRTIVYGPVTASMASLLPKSVETGYPNLLGVQRTAARVIPTRHPIYGVLAIAQNCLLFEDAFNHRYDVTIPLKNINSVALQTVGSLGIAHWVRVDFESSDGWQVHMFRPQQWREFANALAAATGLSVRELGTSWRTAATPVMAMRMKQDIYGQWHGDYSDVLYLTPDRLIFGWQDTILFTNIQTLTIYHKNSLLDIFGSFEQDLLHIDYLPQTGAKITGRSRVIGYQLPRAYQWAELISAQAGIPLTVSSGRKKTPAD